MSPLRVILWGYKGSPFVFKAECLLAVKGIPYSMVEVPMLPPRPQLLDKLGIAYRKVPVMAIGNDVYCDTSSFPSVLERRFPSGGQIETLYPERVDGGAADPALMKAFNYFWADKVLFSYGARLMPWEKIPNLMKDRLDMAVGKKLSQAQEERPQAMSALHANLTVLEEQLHDGRSWMINTSRPGVADVNIYSFMQWYNSIRSIRVEVFNEGIYPKTMRWYQRFSNWLDQAQKHGRWKKEKISADEAVTIMRETGTHPDVEPMIDVVDAARWKLHRADEGKVAVTPEDSGFVPTIGKLLGLDFHETIIETEGDAGVAVRVHFPRIGYTMKSVSETKPKL